MKTGDKILIRGGRTVTFVRKRGDFLEFINERGYMETICQKTEKEPKKRPS